MAGDLRHLCKKQLAIDIIVNKQLSARFCAYRLILFETKLDCCGGAVMGLFDSLLGRRTPEPPPLTPAQRATQEAERKKREEEAEQQRIQSVWPKIEQKCSNRSVISGRAERTEKRPRHEQELVFTVDGLTAYMPISQISTEFVSDINAYVGKTMNFRITNVNSYTHEITLSARVILEEEKRKKRERLEAERRQREEEARRYQRLLARIAYKDYVTATVISTQKTGVKVRLEDDLCEGEQVEAWIHISQLANKYVKDPTEVVKDGEKVRACVKVKPSGNELELSIREYEEKESKRRKDEAFSELKEGSCVRGKVTKILPKKVFVDLGGIDGSINIAELSTSFVDDPNEIVRLGDEVEAVVTTIDRENNRINLSIRKLLEVKAKQRLRERKSSEEYKNVNNRNLHFEGPLCLRLNADRDPVESKLNSLSESKDNLFRLFPDIANMPADNKLETLLRSTFPDGIKMRVYIRNLTFEGQNGKKVLAIRPVITPGCYLQSVLKPGMSLMFKGRVRGKEFVVDSIYDTTDTEQLDYEVMCDVTPFRDLSRVQQNFLFDVLEQAASITKHTSTRLDEWESYLRWKRTVAQQQIAGCKYYSVSYDETKAQLVFELVAESKEVFGSFRRNLRSRDILAFGNNYSSETWEFAFNKDGDRKGRRSRGVRLGKFNGILAQGYLDDLPEGYTVPLTPKDESSLRASFDTPYMARVAYDLNDDDADDVAEQELEPEEEAEYVRSTLLSNYHNQGFLALSAAGQFALISRFERAIGGLRDDRSKSPNLALWLFDATRARLPKPEMSVKVDEWLNPGIASNENQKTAVQKMLDAPDLCLVQGPPGTGKTTVIAEAIYQMAKRGQRVLIASQSNDAVDNALDRLAESPQIRAIRLGQKSRRKAHMDGYAPHKYSEDEAVRSYYASVSSALSRSWIDGWDALDAKVGELDKDARDARYFKDDIARLRKRHAEHQGLLNDLKKKLGEQLSSLEVAQSAHEALVQEQGQSVVLRTMLSGHVEGKLFLSSRQLEVIVPALSGSLEEALSDGLKVIPSPMQLGVQSELALNTSIEIAASSAGTLRTLLKKIESANGPADSGEIEALQRQLKDYQSRMLAAMDDGDEEAEAQWKKRRGEVKLAIDRIKSSTGAIVLDDAEVDVLSPERSSELEAGNTDDVAMLIRRFLDKWGDAISGALTALDSIRDEAPREDPDAIIESIKTTRGRIKTEEAKSSSYADEIAQKAETLTSLAEKYSAPSATADAVIAAIEKAREAHVARMESQKPMRTAWEPVIRGFKDRLDSSEVADYDNDYFKRIYINACNVVGISCTDDMRNLDENGFEAFDVVIIDEVSKATPPEILIPLMKARKAILVGDHRQLPPMFDEHEKSYSELISDPESIPEDLRPLMTGESFTKFQRMVTSSLFKEYFEVADESIKHSLLVQYRMHSDIMDIINRFYDGRLEAGLSKASETRLKNHGLTLKGVDGGSFITPDRHAFWIDSSFLPDGTPVYESFPGRSTSACNYLEVEAIVELLKRMATEYRTLGFGKGHGKSVGVISFYQSQVNELRRRFKTAKKSFDFSAIDVDINTVDRFQGKEKNIIIVSLVRNNKSARASKHVVAFERINVAFSRAQELLVIVGAKHMYDGLQVDLPNMDTGEIRNVPVYRYILEDLNLKGCLRSTSQIIGEESAKRVVSDVEKNRSKNEAR